MPAPAQFHFGVLRDSITSILQYLSVRLRLPPNLNYVRELSQKIDVNRVFSRDVTRFEIFPRKIVSAMLVSLRGSSLL